MPFQRLLLLIGALSIPDRQQVEGGSLTMPIPPGSKGSATGTGEQTVTFTLGEGIYELYAASIKHDTLAETITGRISYIYKTGDGTEIEVILTSGHIAKYLPLTLTKTVFLTGPGYVKSICFHGSSMAHTFNVEYRRYTSMAELGVVR